MSLLSNTVTDKWTSGKLEINEDMIKFPTSALQMSNISHIGVFTISWKKYVIPVTLALLSMYFLSTASQSPQFSRGFGVPAPNHNQWIVFGIAAAILAVITFPKYRHYLQIIANSGSSLLIAGKRDFVEAAQKAIVLYIESKSKSSFTININAEQIGDLVVRDKYVTT